jgi:hypothetical protein
MATSTQNLEKMGKATETMARTTQDSASTAMDHAVKAQEINTNLLQRTTELWIEGLQKQADLSQEMAQEFFNKAEDQAYATQDFLGQWSKAFAGFPSMGFPFMRMAQRTVTNTQKATQQGLRLAEEAAEQTEETIRQTEEATREVELRTVVLGALETDNYDTLTVAEITEKLDDLTADELKRLREFEKRTKDRESLVERIDSKIRTNS